MILQKVEIEQFAGLRDFSVSFGPGNHYIFGENESGKSTLCAFIAAMFYGLPPKMRGQGIKGDSRTLYMPWGENYMGGSLYFQAEGNDYILKRRFGKTAKGDRCELMLADSWEPVAIEAEDIGFHFLGVGQDAYYKTIYMGQLSAFFEKGKEDELMERLSNLEQTGDEDISVEKAVDSLEKKRLDLVTKTGRGGLIPQIEADIIQLENQLYEAKREGEAFQAMLLSIRSVQKETEETERQLADIEEKRKQALAYKAYTEQQEDKERKEKTIAFLHEIEKEQKTVTEKIEELTKQTESLAFVSGLEDTILVSITEKEATLSAIEEKLQAGNVLEEEIAHIEEQNSQQPVGNKKTVLISLALVFLLLGIMLGAFVSPFGYFVAVLSILPLAFLLKAFKQEKSGLGAKAVLEEKKLALLKMDMPHLFRQKEQILLDINSVYLQAEVSSKEELSHLLSRAKSLGRELEDKIKESKRLQAEGENYRTLLQEAEEAQKPLPPVSYEGDSLEILEQKREEKLTFLAQTQKKLATLEAQAEHGFTGAKSVSLIESAILEKKEKLAYYKEQYDIISLALQVLQGCGEELKKTFAPALNEKSGRLLGTVTENRYKQARISDEYKIMVKDEQSGEIIPSDYVSGGTFDLLYVALRLSVLETLYEKIPLLVMDDTFIQFDPKREEKAFQILQAEPVEQVLYFSCRKPPADLTPYTITALHTIKENH